MNLRAISVTAALSVIGLVYACSSSDDDERRYARKGEACQSTNDCSPGLACMPGSAGQSFCVLGAFSLTATAKECAVVDCQGAVDCCPTPPSNCDTLLAQCIAADSGTSSACLLYESQCKCDTAKRDCENSKCVTKCTTNTECVALGSRFCSGGKCVACSIDSDCGSASSGLKCVSGTCKPPCKGDGDCPGFERCVNETCVDGSCQTNRECVAATRNVEATCGTDGKCIVPCATDLECGNPKGYTFFSCVNGQCLFLGCESDKDCRLLYPNFPVSSSTSSSSSSSGSSGALGAKQHVICREKQTPGAVTKPAN